MADSSWLVEHKPVLAMVLVQCLYAAMTLCTKAAFNQGMSPMVFIVYRQAIATLVLVPTTILAKGWGSMSLRCLGLRAFGLVFVAAIVGVTVNQYFYYQGLELASSAMATAMSNLTPAITFVMAAAVGLETVRLKSLRTMAKVIGTVICIGGAMCMAFFKGPELLHTQYQNFIIFLQSVSENWVKGALFLVGSNCCWSFWLLLQVPICKTYFDPLSLSAWMCFLSTFQSAIFAFFLEPDLNAWKINSIFVLFCCLFVGIFGSGVTFCLQSWCISVRGPLFSAMFNPLSTVITAILASILLHEKLYIGSVVGAVAVLSGLYIVLWGKAKDLETKKSSNGSDDLEKITVSIDPQEDGSEADLKKPLLAERQDSSEKDELEN